MWCYCDVTNVYSESFSVLEKTVRCTMFLMLLYGISWPCFSRYLTPFKSWWVSDAKIFRVKKLCFRFPIRRWSLVHHNTYSFISVIIQRFRLWRVSGANIIRVTRLCFRSFVTREVSYIETTSLISTTAPSSSEFRLKNPKFWRKYVSALLYYVEAFTMLSYSIRDSSSNARCF